jgi:hypothetical protein
MAFEIAGRELQARGRGSRLLWNARNRRASARLRCE